MILTSLKVNAWYGPLDAADFQKEVTLTFNDMFITQTASQNQLIFVPLEYCNALL